MPSARATALGLVLVGLSARPSNAWTGGPLSDRRFRALQGKVRAELASDHRWRALPLADALAGRDDLDAAQRLWALREAARVHFLVGDRDGAEDALRRALATAPGDAGTLRQWAALLRDERPDDALRYARQAADPRLEGEIELDQGDLPAARASLEKALAADGRELDALLAAARAWRGETAAAGYAVRAQQAAAEAPLWMRAAALRSCAQLWLELGDQARAVACDESALAVDPDDLDALNSLADIQAKDPSVNLAPPAEAAAQADAPPGGLDQALTALAKAPEDLEALRQAFLAERAAGRTEPALDLADRFMEAVPDAPAWQKADAYRTIGELLAEMGSRQARQKADGAAQRAFQLGMHRVKVALLLMKAHPDVHSPDAPGSAEFAGLTFLEVIQARERLRDSAGARAALQRAARRLPDNHELTLAAAGFELEEGRADDALKAVEPLLPGAGPSALRAAAYELKAKAQQRLKDPAGAVATLERALAVDPFQERALDLLIDAELAAGRPKEALGYVDRLSALAPAGERSAVLRRRGQVQRALGDQAGAEDSVKQALALAPDDRQALIEMIDLLGPGRPREALSYARRLVKACGPAGDEECAAAYRRQAQAQRGVSDQAGVEESLRRALDLRPGDWRELSEMVDLELARGKPKEALAYAERLTATQGAEPPARAAACRRKAQAQRLLGDDAGARDSLERGLALAPDDRDVLTDLVELETRTGRRDPAQAYARRLSGGLDAALAAAPGDWTTLRERAALELSRGRPEKAAALLDLHRDRLDAAAQPSWLIWRALVRLELRDPAGARTDVSKGVGLDAKTACLGGELPKGREKLGLPYFDACLRRLPEEPKLYVDRGVANFEAGRVDAAVADFRKALVLKPGDAGARQSLEAALASAQKRR